MDDVNELTEFVWLEEIRTHGILLSLGAYYSLVRYTREGIDYEVLTSNDDIKFLGERPDDADPED